MGYYYNVNEVVGAGVVGVPIAHVDGIALRQSLFVVGIITVVFGILFVIVTLLVRRRIVQPMLRIGHEAEAISKGQFDTEMSELDRDDEIGHMAKAIELMRRSLKIVMQRQQKH